MEYLLGSKAIEEKLGKRSITLQDCVECFMNQSGKSLEDTREEHLTTPKTYWIISRTDKGRLLKVCFMFYIETKQTHIKTAYEPNQTEIDIYERFS